MKINEWADNKYFNIKSDRLPQPAKSKIKRFHKDSQQLPWLQALIVEFIRENSRLQLSHLLQNPLKIIWNKIQKFF